MGAFWGVMTALSIGTADLFGRQVVRASSALRAVVTMQFVAALTGLAGLLVVAGVPDRTDLLLAAVSGVGWAIGITCYYEGLNRSSSVIVSPLVAVLSTVLPYAFAVVRGGDVTALSIAGAAVAVVGIAMISGRRKALNETDTASVSEGLRWATRSGLGYAFGLIVAIEISAESGAWPVVSQRVAAGLVVAAFAIASRRRVDPPVRMLPLAALGGVFIGLSTLFYLFGVQADAGPAVITSNLFPIFTVAVGHLMFSDAITRRQLAGFALSLVGVIAVISA